MFQFSSIETGSHHVFYDMHRQDSLVSAPSSPCPTGCTIGSAHWHDPDSPLIVPSPSPAPSSTWTEVNPSQASLPPEPGCSTTDHAALASLISHYGSATSTAWLDRSRYKIWSPSQPIPESEFTPVQGYIRKDPFIFAWGNPLVSSPAALEITARAFIAFAESLHLRPIWTCVDHVLETVLAGKALGWVTVSCIYEDVIDSQELVELTAPEHKGEEGSGLVHNLKHTLRRAEREHVDVHEVKGVNQWGVREKEEVEAGIRKWKAHRGVADLESMDIDPWLDSEHRRYWVAKVAGRVVGILILTQIQPLSWQVVKCLVFSNPPRGASESLIYAAVKNLYEQAALSGAVVTPEQGPPGEPSTEQDDRTQNRVKVSFGITASDHLEAGHNVRGWKVSILSHAYATVSGITALKGTGQFRKKFHPKHEPMFICYPVDGLGLIAVGALLMALRK